MDRDRFGQILAKPDEPGRMSRKRRGLALIADVQQYDPERWETFIAALRSGASFRAAAGILGVQPETISRWLERGRGARQGAYRRFYRAVMKALQEATAIAEIKVLERNPENWLRNGPGKVVSPEWREDGKKVEVEVTGGIETSGKLQVAHVDVVEALKHIQAAGLDVGVLTRSQAELHVVEGMAEDDQDEDDAAGRRGTNYVGDGTWASENPCLPGQVQDRLKRGGVLKPKPDQELLAKTEGEVVAPQQGGSLLERMRRLRGT